MGNYVVETQKPQQNRFLEGHIFQLPAFIDLQWKMISEKCCSVSYPVFQICLALSPGRGYQLLPKLTYSRTSNRQSVSQLVLSTYC